MKIVILETIESPCQFCKERHEACHDSCEKYKAWKTENEKTKEHIALEKQKQRFNIKDTKKRRHA